MKRNMGFTLVELLVVIAIIAILAGIVIPNVPKYINKARGVRAFAEVKNIDLSITKMLTDANRTDFANGFFVLDGPNVPANIVAQVEQYSNAFYVLLRKGKYAEQDGQWPAWLALEDDVRRTLSDQYMDISKDPWGSLYNFYPGPFHHPNFITPAGKVQVPFRVYQSDTTVPGSGFQDDSGFFPGALRTVTDPDDPAGAQLTIGYAAPRKQIVYVWSNGKNKKSNQYFNDGYNGDPADIGLDFIGGGDDINNWDTGSSWQGFYN